MIPWYLLGVFRRALYFRIRTFRRLLRARIRRIARLFLGVLELILRFLLCLLLLCLLLLCLLLLCLLLLFGRRRLLSIVRGAFQFYVVSRLLRRLLHRFVCRLFRGRTALHRLSKSSSERLR